MTVIHSHRRARFHAVPGYPPLPSQPVKSLKQRLAEVEKLKGSISPRAVSKIKEAIRESAKDFGEDSGEIRSQPINNDDSITIEYIQRVIALHFDITVEQLRGRRNIYIIARPRQIAMYFAKQLTARSLPEIGRMFGCRHHTTILYAVRAVTALVDGNRAVAEEIAALREMILS